MTAITFEPGELYVVKNKFWRGILTFIPGDWVIYLGRSMFLSKYGCFDMEFTGQKHWYFK